MPILSLDEKNLLAQANRRLTNMSKRASDDKNVENALKFATADLRIFTNGGTRYKVTPKMTERQKNAVLRSAQKLIDSPYSTQSETQQLYRRQRNTFAERYGVSKKVASAMIKTFNKDNDPKVAEAWERIRGDVKYESIKQHLKDGMFGETVENIGDEKFGQLFRLYAESGLITEQDFASFISDPEYISFANQFTADEMSELINNRFWEM